MKTKRLFRHFTLIWVSVLMLVTLLGVGIYFVFCTAADVARQTQQYLSEMGKQNGTIINVMVNTELECLTTLAHVIEQMGDFTQEEALELLEHEISRMRFKRLGYIDYKGDAVTTDGYHINLMNREYYQRAMGGQKAVSDRIVDRIDGEDIQVYAVPVHRENKVKGVIFAVKDTTGLEEVLSIENFDGEGFSYIINKDGEIVVYTTHKNSLKLFNNFYDEMEVNGLSKNQVMKLKAQMRWNNDGIIEYRLNGRKRIAAYSKIAVNEWYVITVVPYKVYARYSSQLMIRAILSVLLTAGVLGLLIYLITVQNSKNKKALTRIAYTDQLTGSSNFFKFKEDTKKILRENPLQEYLLIKFDVAEFKVFNELHGYLEGDKLLRDIASWMEHIIDRGIEAFGRIGADEFILLKKFSSHVEADKDRAEFEDYIYQKVNVEYDYDIRIDFGRYLLLAGEITFGIAYERVNFAHRKAKNNEDTNLCDYDDEVMEKLLQEKEIENKMVAALIHKEFHVYLQPKVYLVNRKIAGAEALVRWDNGKKLISPGQFISVFEKNGFIVRLDLYMFEQVCALVRRWLDEGKEPIVVSINFSRRHIKNNEFVSELCRIADQYEVPKNLLEIELTETVMMENEKALLGILEEIHEKGFTLSMDDFGTGYSSLGLLKNIPVDVIKIDRSFFVDAEDMERTKTVLRNMIKMAKELAIHTVAEGVEEEEHITLLSELSCDIVQGYYFYKPMKAEEFFSLL